MRYLRLFAGPDGESHWQEVEVNFKEREFAPPAKAIEVSSTETATGTVFLRLKPGWDEPVHTSPLPQTLVCTRGAARVTASDGTFRDIGPGDIWRMEDTHGKGHHTRVVGPDHFECLIVQHG